MARSHTRKRPVRQSRKPNRKRPQSQEQDDRAKVWLHIKCPPEELIPLSRFPELPSLYVGWPSSHSPLEAIGRKFSSTPSTSPLEAFQAVVIADHLGVYPPKAVLAWLADRFRRYLAKVAEYSLAPLSLDRILGLVGGGKEHARGQRSLVFQSKQVD